MSEALRKQTPLVERPRQDALEELLPPVQPAEVNDNEASPARVGERLGFEIPAPVWYAMIACYGVFLAALLGATGGARAGFAIIISALYVAVFFGTVRILLRHAPAQPRSPLDGPSRRLPTLYGSLRKNEVLAQMLIVPGAVALFGVAILLIRVAVG